MTTKWNFRRSILASIALFAFGATSLVACVGAPESGDDESAGEVSQSEPVGEAEQAVGEGGFCTAAGPFCNRGLTCCGLTCVNLLSDESNCGSCGNVCQGHEWGGPPWCSNGVCQ